MLILVLFAYGLLIVFEFIPLYKRNEARDFKVNMILGILSLTIAILLSLDIKIPSPAKPIKDLIDLMLGK